MAGMTIGGARPPPPFARKRAALAFILAAAGVVVLEGRASAQASSSQSQAEPLFNEGRELLEKGRFAEACPKLARSQALAPAVGTLLNLGYCWEQLGKLRSA